MKNIILIIFSVVFCFNSFSQHGNLRKCDSVILSITKVMDSFPNRNLLKDSIAIKTKTGKDSIALLSRRDSIRLKTTLIHNRFELIYRLLVRQERVAERYYENQLSKETSSFLHRIERLEIIQGIYRAAVESFSEENSPEEQKIRDVFLNKIAEQINMMSKNTYPWYNYNVRDKKIIKGIILNSSNDLFTLSGLYGELFPQTKNYPLPFQRNNDMDFTGALKVGVVTDYLKLNRNREIKSYQTLSYGFEVYTPYFRVDSIFKDDTSFNESDRPHASIRYISLETNGVSYNHGFRWNAQVKVGKIGGDIGKLFQTVLHQDVSSSPRPVGWGAQIAYPGRLAFSLEFRPELLFGFKKWGLRSLSIREKSRINTKFTHLYSSLTGDFAVGNYMTYAGLGIQLSNKNFRSSNQDYMTVRHTTKRSGWKQFSHLNVNFHARYRYVAHNTMLEGYGYFNTTEANSDNLTPKSRYYLNDEDGEDQVRRLVQYYDLTFSTQKKHFSIFYKMSIKSPEVKNLSEDNFDVLGNQLNMNTRWHHYSTIGVCFKL